MYSLQICSIAVVKQYSFHRHKDLVLPVQPLSSQIIALFSSVPWSVDGCLLSWERLCV